MVLPAGSHQTLAFDNLTAWQAEHDRIQKGRDTIVSAFLLYEFGWHFMCARLRICDKSVTTQRMILWGIQHHPRTLKGQMLLELALFETRSPFRRYSRRNLRVLSQLHCRRWGERAIMSCLRFVLLTKSMRRLCPEPEIGCLHYSNQTFSNR